MLSLRLYGPVALSVDGAEVVLGSPKLRGVLVLLALEPGRVVSTDRLMDELWPDSPPATADSTLQVYVSRLRRSLADADAAASVVRRRPGYLLEIDRDAIDVHRAERLLEATRTELRDGRVGDAVRTSAEAFELVREPPLADVGERLGPVVKAEVGRLEELALAVREVRAEALLADGQSAAAAGIAAGIVGAAPLREEAQVLLMRALYRSGRASEALEVYARVREHLDEELGTEPGPALRRVHAQVLRQDSSLDPPEIERPATEDSGAPSPALIGRHDTLASLSSALQEMVAGRGGVRVVDGDAGIGKTTLATAVAEQARSMGVTVAWGRCDEAAVDVPLWPWQQVVRGLPQLPREGAVSALLGVPDLDLTPGPAAQLRLQVGLADELVGSTEPILVVLEDIHWADPWSLAALVSVAERCAGGRVLVLATQRSDVPTDRLVDPLARLARLSAARRLSLRGLSAGEVAELLDRVGAPGEREQLAEVVHQRTNGNPFYVTELARTAAADGSWSLDRLRADVPGTVRDVVAARLAALPAAARELLDVTAVAAPIDDLDVLARVAELEGEEFDEALEVAVTSGLLRERADPRPAVEFTHSLIREATADRLRPSRRARLHAAIATEALTRPRLQHDDAVVHHLLAGRSLLEPMTVLPPLLAAARRRLESYAMTAAEDYLEDALDVLRGLPDGPMRDEFEMAVNGGLGISRATRAGWGDAQAEEALARAQALAGRLPPSPALVEALAYRTALLTTLGRFDDLDRLCEVIGSKAAAETPWRPALLILHRLAVGGTALFRGDLERAVAELESAVRDEAVDESGGAALLLASFGVPVRAFLALALASGNARGGEALEVSDVAVRRAADLPILDRAGAHIWRAMAAAALHDPVVALEDGALGLADATRSGAEIWELLARTVYLWAQVHSPGRDAEAAQLLADVREMNRVYTALRATGVHGIDPILGCLLAEALHTAGEPEDARAAAEDAMAAATRSGSTLWTARLADAATA